MTDKFDQAMGNIAKIQEEFCKDYYPEARELVLGLMREHLWIPSSYFGDEIGYCKHDFDSIHGVDEFIAKLFEIFSPVFKKSGVISKGISNDE